MAVQYDIIEKSGAWFSYNGEKIGQGRENVRLFLNSHPDVYDQIDQQIQQMIKNKNAASLQQEL